MHLFMYDEDDRRYLSLRLGVPLALLAAAVTAVVVLLAGDGRDAVAAGSDQPAAGAPVAGLSEECRVALERAEEALGGAQRVRDHLAAQTAVMIDLDTGRVDAEEAARRAQPVLSKGALDSLQLDVARQRYDAAARTCRSVS